jgi:hypothetical protein
MKRSHLSLPFLSIILILVSSCGKSLPELTNIDLEVWQQDRNGCLGKRAEMKNSLEQQKNKLLGLSETQIGEILGRPDDNELYKRNQKFYHYAIEASKNCGAVPLNSSPKELIIRFTAMGIANEVSIE